MSKKVKNLYTCKECGKANTAIERCADATDHKRCAFCGAINQSIVSFYIGLFFKSIVTGGFAYLGGLLLGLLLADLGMIIAMGIFIYSVISKILTFHKKLSVREHVRSNLPNFDIDDVIGFRNLDILIDRDRRTMMVLEDEEQTALINIESILEINMLAEQSTKVGGSMGRSLVGGVIGGTMGSIIGSSGSRKVTSTLESLTVQIGTSNPQNPYYTFKLEDSSEEKLQYKSSLLRSQLSALSIQ